ncbi:hypothetical protein D3C81_731730 [compost metagenome]
MKLMLAQKWAEKYFDKDSQPDAQLLGRWCRQGKIPCQKVVASGTSMSIHGWPAATTWSPAYWRRRNLP